MSEEVLKVESRSETGKLRNKRLRQSGKIPAVLYGHGKETVSLTLDAAQLALAIRHNAHLVRLEGAARETALLKDVQWDAYGSSVLHVDLTRVDADESVEVELEIQLRGNAPGTKQGGVVEQPMHRIGIECPASRIPEYLELNVNALELGQSLTVSDLDLPEGAKALQEAEAVIAACVEPTEMPEEEAVADGAEPEVIGAKSDEESSEE